MSVDVICVGEAGWDLLSEDDLRRPRAFFAVPGGAAVNTARALARIGLRAAVCCAVGDDPLGRALVDRLRSDGVGVSLMRRALERTSVVLVGRDSVMSLRRVREEIAALPDLAPTRWNARHLHVAALLPGRRAAGAYRRFAEVAKRQGCTLSVDVDARPRFWRALGAPPRAILRAADLVKCSSLDLVALGLGRGSRAITELRRWMSPSATLVVTDGPRSARAIGPWGEIARAPRPMDAAHAIGAGDAFSAGVIAELLASGGAARDAGLWRRALDRGHRAARTVIVAAS